MTHKQAKILARRHNVWGATVEPSMYGTGYRVDYVEYNGAFHSIESGDGPDFVVHDYASRAAFDAFHESGDTSGVLGSRPMWAFLGNP